MKEKGKYTGAGFALFLYKILYYDSIKTVPVYVAKQLITIVGIKYWKCKLTPKDLVKRFVV